MAGQLVRATGSSGTLGYEYDRGGRLVRQHDEATGETVTYAYDKAGRRILMAGVGRETAYRYGRNGELLEVSDNRQRLSVSYKYDVMGRETGEEWQQHSAAWGGLRVRQPGPPQRHGEPHRGGDEVRVQPGGAACQGTVS